jgi:flagellar motor protein MotB
MTAAVPLEVPGDASAPAQAGLFADLDCPVCPRTGVAHGTRHCPNCGVDLQPIWNLRELPARYYNEGLQAARRGELRAALTKLLCALEAGHPDLALRVVLGKVCWQLGDRRQAQLHWAQALAQDPRHAESRRLLRHARRRSAARRLAACAAILLAGSALVVAGWMARDLERRAPRVARVGPARDSSRFFAVALPPVSVPSPALGPALELVAERLSAEPDLRLQPLGAELRVEFAAGLFDVASETPTPEAAQRLARLAALLGPVETPLLITVAGRTDSVPIRAGGRWPSNEDLALARARGAIRALLEGLGPDSAVALRPAVFAGPPLPGDSAARQARSRTVVLLLSAR